MIDAFRVSLSAPDDFDGWRDAARGLADIVDEIEADRAAIKEIRECL